MICSSPTHNSETLERDNTGEGMGWGGAGEHLKITFGKNCKTIPIPQM